MNFIGSRALLNRNGSKIGYLDGSGVFRDIEGRCLGVKMDHCLSNKIVDFNNSSTGMSIDRLDRIVNTFGSSTGLNLGPIICSRIL